MPRKIAVVTGAYGGLGSELCKLIAADGVELILVDRNLEKSKAFAVDLNRSFPAIVRDCFAVDLADHSSIKTLTAAVIQKYPKIDLLFNNAGVLTESLQFSGHKNELHLEVNTFAPLQLIDQLRPSLKNAGGGMVVSTSAGLSDRVQELDFEDLIAPKEFTKLFGSYARSKQALNVLTSALSSEMAADGIVLRAADPGPLRTALTKGAGTPLWMRIFYWALPTPAKGAKKIFDASVPTDWGGQSGIFIENKKVQPLPPTLADQKFQMDFLRKCRERAAVL